MLRVTTLNLRTGNMPDGANHWELRKHFVADVIRTIDPDFLGAQEALAPQYDFLTEQFSATYAIAGVCRDDGCREGEATPLLIRRERFDVLDSSTFWLSDSPQAIGGKGWDAHYPRICTWARIRDRKTRGGEILVLNTHFDHAGVVAQRQSAVQLRRFIAQHAGDASVVLLGDFNTGPDSDPHRALLIPGGDGVRLTDTYRATHPIPSADEATWHGFTGATRGVPIDWILCSPHFRIESCAIDRTSREGRYPSDHFPVIANLELR